MGRTARAVGWIGVTVVALVVLVAGGTWMVVQTQPGHDFLLRTALQQLPRYVEGEVEVGGVRSDGILRGFTLHDVAIRDVAGRPFVEVDSVAVRYSARGLLRREIVLSPAQLWAPRVTIEAIHGDPRWNAERIFVPESAEERTEASEPGTGPGVSLMLRSARIHDGEVVIRRPIEWDGEHARSLIEWGPNEGGAYHVLRFEDIDARLAAADLVDDDVDGQRFRVESLSFTGHVLDEPFRIEDLRGDVLRRGGAVSLRADRLWLSGSELDGSVTVDWSDGVEVDGYLFASILDFADFHWIEPRIPHGSGTLQVQVSGPVDGLSVRVTSADVGTAESRVRGDIGLELGDPFRLVDADLELLPFRLSELDPWLDEPSPVQGIVRGSLLADGALDALRLRGNLSIRDPERGIPESTASLDGLVHLTGDLAATDLDFDLNPLNYGTLAAFVPDFELRGAGTAEGRVSGSLRTGLDLAVRLTHVADGLDESELDVRGDVRVGSDDVHLALDADLVPLSLDGLAMALGIELPVFGSVSGPFRAEGPLGDLLLSGRLDTEAGLIDAWARFDAREPTDRYRAEGTAEEFRLEEFVTAVPENTVLSGDFVLDGRGGEPESLSGNASLRLIASTVAGIELDHLSARLLAQGGRLFVEDLELSAPAGRISGGGDLALRSTQPQGEVFVVWEIDSLADLGPTLAGTDGAPFRLPAASLEPGLFGFEGVEEADPAVEGVPLSGTGRGELRLRGGFSSLVAEGFAELDDAGYDLFAVERGRADFVGRWEGNDDWDVEAVLDLEDFVVERFEFSRGSGEVAYRPSEGTFRIDVDRNGVETYRTAGGFAHTESTLEVALASLSMELDEVVWSIADPTGIRVEGRSVRVDDLRIVRPAGGGEAGDVFEIEIAGLLDLEGDSDIHASLVGVDLERLGRIIQTERLPSGSLDLVIDIAGPADAPRISSDVAVRNFAYDSAELSLVEGTARYSDRLVALSLQGDLLDRTPLMIDGRFPIDLSFREVEDRFPEREIDVRLAVAALPIATALGFLEVLEDLEGTVEGELRLRGTPDALEPSGMLQLRDGGVHLSGIGLRTSQVAADLRLFEDRTVEVIAEARSRGAAHVVGTITLDQLSSPAFDLEVVANGFQAVDRRDLAARVGGTVRLTGRYTEPRVTGRVRVEEGELFLEEVARTAEVIDLADPRFFDVVDTTLVAVRPTMEAAQNPFLRNLVVDVELGLQRDFWLRSREMDAEIGGDLAVTFERPAGEVLLVGSLEATRGSYTQFGRQFQVQSGTVEFPGTPGIDPALNIQAVHRLRRQGEEPLNIIANVEGTLVSPRVRLTTDAQPPIAESDLVSYLLFGRPSYDLASGEASVLQATERAAVSMGIGTVATQLGSVVARQFGVDYFAITQTQDPEGFADAAGRSQFAHTQIEVGQYIGNNVFLALILRPLTGLGATTQNQVPGARLEWRFADTWSMEGFVEDRFAREGASRFGDAGVSLSQVFGLSVFREWGF